MVDGLLISVGAAAFSFGLGYCFRRTNLKWRDQARLAERKAELNADQLQATVAASLDGIIVINLDGKIIDFSASAETIFNYKREDVIGKSMAELIVPQRYRAAHNAGMKRMKDTGQAKILGQRIEIEALRADGTEFMSELAISRNSRDSGDIFIAYIRDISEAKAAQTALIEAKDAAEKASHVKSKFLAAMSHEIRTPFNAVLGILDILGETPLNKDQRDLVKTAEKSSLALLRVINDVLDYARISSGNLTSIEDIFSARDVFDDVFQLFKVKAKDIGVDFTIDASEAANVYLRGDLGRIRQILMNYVSNALKFTDSGSISLKIITEQSSEDMWNLKCIVEDTGIGISELAASKLFDEFFMVDDSDSRRHDGTGLGLTISKIIAEMMGGHIGVNSELGKGSQFWVSLPLPAAAKGELQPRYPSSNADISDCRILLAEDNKTNQMVVSRILSKHCKSITIADNGTKVLDALEDAEFDIILMDIFMPEMSGKEACRHIRESKKPYRDIPIIALTAMGNFHDIQNLKSSGMNDVVTKPFKRTDLIAAIASNLSDTDYNMDDASQSVKLALTELLGELTPDELFAFQSQFELDLKAAANAMDAALVAKDIRKIIHPSHTLKGLAATYGLSDLSRLADKANILAEAGETAQCHRTTKKTITLARETLSNLDTLFGTAQHAA